MNVPFDFTLIPATESNFLDMTENIAHIGINQNLERRLGLFSKIKKAFETRYTIDGRMLREKEKLEKIQEVLTPEQQQALFERLQKSVRHTIVTDIIVGSAIVVSGVLLYKNRQQIGDTIRRIVGKEMVELTPEQWAIKIKADAHHIGLMGSLKEEEYHAGDWNFKGRNQGPYQFVVTDKIKACLDERYKKAASALKDPNLGEAEVYQIYDAIYHSAGQYEANEGPGINVLYISSPFGNQLGEGGKGLVGIAYKMFTDPEYIKGYYDNRHSPLIWQILVPEKLAKQFGDAIYKNPNIVHDTMRSMLSGLFEKFSTVPSKELHVYRGGLDKLLNNITKIARPKVFVFSPQVS